MIWFPLEGGELRNGVNLEWSRGPISWGPIVWLSWMTTRHVWRFRVRVRCALLDRRLHLILQWTSADIGKEHDNLGIRPMVNIREWRRDYSLGVQAA